MGRFFGRIKGRVGRLTRRMDQYQEAITFAEAGHQRDAQALADEKGVQEKPGKLLVIGRESTFSQEVIDYALEMAQRMSYEILALNTAPLSCETFKLFSSSRNKVCQEFRGMSEENVRVFREEAEKAGIPFSHVVKYSEPDEALEELKGEYKDIEFVVSEAEGESVANRTRDGERAKGQIYVYSMV